MDPQAMHIYQVPLVGVDSQSILGIYIASGPVVC